MSKLAYFRQLKEQKEQLERELQQMADTPQVQGALEFERELRQLMARYNANTNDVLNILRPSHGSGGGKKPKQYRPWPLRTYRNPHTGEVVQTRSSNQAQIRAWRARWGDDVVNGWWTIE